MKIYIPRYLRKLGMIDEMYQLLSEFSKLTDFSENNESFSVYSQISSSDPVYSFLKLVYKIPVVLDNGSIVRVNLGIEKIYDDIPEGYTKKKVLSEASEKSSGILNYLTALFYSVKGTFRVFDYLRDYNIIDLVESEIKYTVKSISVTVKSIDGITSSQFCDSFEKFLSALLFFEKLSITIKSNSLSVSDNLLTRINHGNIYYKYERV